MLRHIMPRYAIVCHVNMLRYVRGNLGHVILFVMLSYAMLWYLMSCHTVHCYAISCLGKMCYAVLCYSVAHNNVVLCFVVTLLYMGCRIAV